MILRILAIVSAIFAANIFFVSKGKLAEQQVITQKAEQATVAVQSELAAANEQISALEGSLNIERDALANEKRQLESVRSEMYTARQELSRTQQQMSEAKKSITNLESTAERLRADLLQSEQSLTSASRGDEIAQLNERVAELEKSNADLKESLEDTKATSSTSRSAVSPGGSSSTKSVATYRSGFTAPTSQALPIASITAETTIESLSASNGLIALANSPELGLNPGATVTIVKKLKALGKIQVSQVSDDLVLANLLPGAKTREMIAGTTVSLLR
jgi:predicted  nucleic acid-binding Zn-ribbon protein